MLYDGECPLCMREVNMLKGRDEGIGKIDFVDISNPNYSEEDNANLTYEEVECWMPTQACKSELDAVWNSLPHSFCTGQMEPISNKQTVFMTRPTCCRLWEKYMQFCLMAGL